MYFGFEAGSFVETAGCQGALASCYGVNLASQGGGVELGSGRGLHEVAVCTKFMSELLAAFLGTAIDCGL
jgi:hypothetical protein